MHLLHDMLMGMGVAAGGNDTGMMVLRNVFRILMWLRKQLIRLQLNAASGTAATVMSILRPTLSSPPFRRMEALQNEL